MQPLVAAHAQDASPPPSATRACCIQWLRLAAPELPSVPAAAPAEAPPAAAPQSRARTLNRPLHQRHHRRRLFTAASPAAQPAVPCEQPLERACRPGDPRLLAVADDAGPRRRRTPRQSPNPRPDTSHLPRDLSPWAMFMAADIVVKSVMIGLAFASVVTWTVWLAKSVELAWSRRRLSA